MVRVIHRSPASFAASFTAALTAAALLTLATVGITIGAAAAESPIAVADELADDGVFVGFGRRDVDEDALIAAVEDARFDGLRLVAVAPVDPQPDAAAFARRIQEQTDADAAIVFPKEGPLETYVIEDLSSSRIRATAAAREFAEPARAVEAFATEIGSVREAGTPEIVDEIMRALVLMALVIGVVVVIEQIVAHFKRPDRKKSGQKKLESKLPANQAK
ncbi:MAG: hypothetical protein ACRBK7_31345 [Acidimicrobiales bacterium]